MKSLSSLDTEQIAKFIQSYFNWTHVDHSITPTCDREAFLDWQCCPFHQQCLQEFEHFQQTARTIESQFSFYQGIEPSVLSQAWFLRLSAVSGIPLPARKMATWEYTEAPQIVEDYLAISDHTFTLIFRPGAIAVLQVHGAESLDEARAFAASILPNAAYEVRDGDETGGHVNAFQAWTCVQAQQERPTRVSDLNDVDLARCCDQTEEVIDRLTRRNELDRLREALDLREMLELEQMCRLVCSAARQIREEEDRAEAR